MKISQVSISSLPLIFYRNNTNTSNIQLSFYSNTSSPALTNRISSGLRDSIPPPNVQKPITTQQGKPADEIAFGEEDASTIGGDTAVTRGGSLEDAKILLLLLSAKKSGSTWDLRPPVMTTTGTHIMSLSSNSDRAEAFIDALTEQYEGLETSMNFIAQMAVNPSQLTSFMTRVCSRSMWAPRALTDWSDGSGKQGMNILWFLPQSSRDSADQRREWDDKALDIMDETSENKSKKVAAVNQASPLTCVDVSFLLCFQLQLQITYVTSFSLSIFKGCQCSCRHYYAARLGLRRVRLRW